MYIFIYMKKERYIYRYILNGREMGQQAAKLTLLYRLWSTRGLQMSKTIAKTY